MTGTQPGRAYEWGVELAPGSGVVMPADDQANAEELAVAWRAEGRPDARVVRREVGPWLAPAKSR